MSFQNFYSQQPNTAQTGPLFRIQLKKLRGPDQVSKAKKKQRKICVEISDARLRFRRTTVRPAAAASCIAAFHVHEPVPFEYSTPV